MSAGPMYVIAELTIAASLAIFVVGLTSKPLRRFAGALCQAPGFRDITKRYPKVSVNYPQR